MLKASSLRKTNLSSLLLDIKKIAISDSSDDEDRLLEQSRSKSNNSKISVTIKTVDIGSEDEENSWGKFKGFFKSRVTGKKDQRSANMGKKPKPTHNRWFLKRNRKKTQSLYHESNDDNLNTNTSNSSSEVTYDPVEPFSDNEKLQLEELKVESFDNLEITDIADITSEYEAVKDTSVIPLERTSKSFEPVTILSECQAKHGSNIFKSSSLSQTNQVISKPSELPQVSCVTNDSVGRRSLHSNPNRVVHFSNVKQYI